MNTYEINVVLTVKIEAFNEADAMEAIDDCFGQGEACGLEVTELGISNVAELK